MKIQDMYLFDCIAKKKQNANTDNLYAEQMNLKRYRYSIFSGLNYDFVFALC